MIYVIGKENNWRNAPIKIGYTSSHSAKPRLANIQTSSPSKLKVINTMAGDKKDEKEIHACLCDFRLTGEWFDTRLMSSNLICLIKRSNSAIDLCVNIKELDTLISSLLNNSHRPSLTDDKLTTFIDHPLDKSDRFILTDEEKYLVRQIQSRLKSESASINSNAHPLGQLVL